MSTSKKRQERRRLTPRQLEILTFIRDRRRKDGYSPTLQEIADKMGTSKVTVFEHVNALEGKGLLRRLPHRARSLEISSDARFPDERPSRLPFLGRIAAGAATEAIAQNEFLDLEEVFTRRQPTFVLRVNGDSMIEENIRPGDFVVAERRDDVRNGDTVVALVDGDEATLKKYYREGNKVRLQPANKKYQPIYPERLEIQGVVIGLIRKY